MDLPLQPDAPAAVAAPAADPAIVPAAEPKPPAESPTLAVELPKQVAAPAAPTVKAEPAKVEQVAQAERPDELAVLRAKIAELEQSQAKSTTALRDAQFNAAFTAAQIAPDYRKFARTELGDIDPSTDAGKAAIDEFAAKHAAMTTRGQAAVDPITAWVDKTKTAAKGNTLAAVMPRGFLADTIAKAVAPGVE